MEKLRFKDEKGNFYPNENKEYLMNLAVIKTGDLNVTDAKKDGLYPFYDRSVDIKKFNAYSYDKEAIIYPGEGSKFLPRYYKGKFGLHQRAYAIFDFKPNIYPIYLYQFLKTKNNHFIKTAVGSTVKSLRMTSFEKCLISLKNIEEQCKIGDFLISIDSMRESINRKIEQLQLLKKGYLQNMFPNKGTSIPKIRFKGFADDWEQCELKEIIDVNSGRDYKHLKEGEIPVYGTGGYMLSVNEALSYNRNAVGIGRKGTIDKPYILKAPFWTVDTLFYAIPKKGNDLSFVYSIFQNINWGKYDESTGVPSLSKTTINSVNTKNPTLPEQIQIGSFLKKIDKLITLHQRKYELLNDLKKGYMQRLFN